MAVGYARLACLLLVVAASAMPVAAVATVTPPPPNASRSASLVVRLTDLKGILAQAHFDGVLDEAAVQSISTSAAAVAVPETTAPAGPFASLWVLQRAASKLTLENVLWFGGALLTIGSMTLFMSKGWERFGGAGLLAIALVYATAFAVIGSTFYRTGLRAIRAAARQDGRRSTPAEEFTGEHMTVGGLFLTMAVAMTPLAVFGYQRMLNVWPSRDPGNFQDFRTYIRGSWVYMEVVTCLTSLLAVLVVPFPFLLAPFAFCLWFLSMDLSPLLRIKDALWKTQTTVSIFTGLAMLVMAYYMENGLLIDAARLLTGSDDMERASGLIDLGFWTYLFGLFAFQTGLLTKPDSNREGSHVLLGFIQCCLLLFSRGLWAVPGERGGDRLMFAYLSFIGLFVFGFVSRYGVAVCTAQNDISHLWHFCRLALAILVLARGVYLQVAIEVLVAMALLLHWQLLSIKKAGSHELYYLFHLAVFLGLATASPSIDAALGHPLLSQMWATQLFFGVLQFHVGTIAYECTPGISVARRAAFHAYRAAVSIAMIFLGVHLQEFPLRAFVLGLAGFGGLALVFVAGGMHRQFKGKWPALPLALCLFPCLGLAYRVDQPIAFLLFIAIAVQHTLEIGVRVRRRTRGAHEAAVLGVLFCATAPLFQSTILVTIGGITLFAYLSYLAYDLFADSMLFPLITSLLGATVMWGGVLYNRNKEGLHALLMHRVPITLAAFEPAARPAWLARWDTDAMVRQPHDALLAIGGQNPLLVPGVIMAGIATLLLVHWVQANGLLESLLAPRRKPLLRVESARVQWSPVVDHRGYPYGLEVVLEITKPAALRIRQCVLQVDGERFWKKAGRSLPGPILSLIRAVILPMRLVGESLDSGALDNTASKCTITLHLATGRRGGAKVSRRTILRVFKDLAGSGDPQCTCTVSESSWLGLLFQRQVYFSVSLVPSVVARLEHEPSVKLAV